VFTSGNVDVEGLNTKIDFIKNFELSDQMFENYKSVSSSANNGAYIKYGQLVSNNHIYIMADPL